MSEKNFRSSYYDKVGFRGVEEKKSLELLINEKSIDNEKLSKFCLRFSIPSIYREYVWKVILGVVPVQPECQDLIMKYRTEHYEEIEESLKVLYKMDEPVSKSVLHALMYLMTEDVLTFNLEKELSNSNVQSLVALASVFIELSTTDVNAFWMFRYFVLLLKKSSCTFKTYKEKFESILRKEDMNLYDHCQASKMFEEIPLELWFERCFAEVLHESSLPRILDKVIGGSLKILAYVATAMMLIRKHSLLSLKDHNKMVKLLENNPEDVSDAVVSKALDMYCKNSAAGP